MISLKFLRFSHLISALLLGAVFFGCAQKNQLTFREPPAEYISPDRLPAFQTVPDPLEGMNRVFFEVTDKTTFYVFDPILRVYRVILPFPIRKGIFNVNENIRFPIRFFGNALQGKWRGTWIETQRFLVNSTLGVGGIFEMGVRFGLKPQNEDFGQAFGKWGMAPGFYLFVPFLGPSSGRDGLGELFNTAANPWTYLGYTVGSEFSFLNLYLRFVSPVFTLNELSLQLDEYTLLRSSQDDAYVFFRDLWTLNRMKEVRDYVVVPPPGEANPLPALGVMAVRSSIDFYRKSKNKKVWVPENNKKFPYSLWLQDKPAAVVCILAGIGAHRTSGLSRYLAQLAYEEGYHVLGISNLFNWEAIKFGNDQAVPGYTPDDAEEVRRVLFYIFKDLDEQYPGQVTQRKVLGYSQGGLQSLYLAAHDADHPTMKLNFERVVSVGSPVDPYHAMKSLDSFYNAPMKWDEKARLDKTEDTLLKAAALLTTSHTELKKLPFTETESAFLFGLASRLTLRDTLYALHTYRELRVFKSEPSWFKRQNLYDEINNFSYSDYLDRVLLPHMRHVNKRTEDNEKLINKAGLYGIESQLRQNKSIRVILNRDDELVSPQDVRWLERTLGERFIPFPQGGHLGNLIYPQVNQAIRDALKSQSSN